MPQECSQARVAAGFAVRFAAYVIDVLIAYLIASALISPVQAVLSFLPGGSPLNRAVLFTVTGYQILKFLATAAYFVLMTYYAGATLGKMMFKLRVVSASGEKPSFFSILYRETIGRYLSSFLEIGYLMIPFDDEKRALHDRLADTRVEYRVKLPTVREVIPASQGLPVRVMPATGPMAAPYQPASPLPNGNGFAPQQPVYSPKDPIDPPENIQ